VVIRALIRLGSPAGRRGRLSILIFHRVLSEMDPMFPNEMHAQHFNEVCGWLKSWFNVMPLDLAIEQLEAGALPPRAAAITFDDGYANNHDVALPILQNHGLKATFFISTGFLDGGRMWNDTVIEAVRAFRSPSMDLSEAGLGLHPMDSFGQRATAVDKLLRKIKYLEPAERIDAVRFVKDHVGVSLPDDLMMTSEQVLHMHRSGMQLGAHTCTHPILASLPDAEAAGEIAGSKRVLESLIQQPVALFAYPNGTPGKDYLHKHVQMVQQAGFKAAVSTSPGVSRLGADMFQLPRFSPWDRKRLQYGLRMLKNLNSNRPRTV
jgi:peptidoglycan/xylan/chitin deacetylase (PgdA/CDA1 family)